MRPCAPIRPHSFISKTPPKRSTDIGKPRNRADADIEGFRNLARRLALGDALPRFLGLVGREDRLRPILTPLAWAICRPSCVRLMMRSRSSSAFHAGVLCGVEPRSSGQEPSCSIGTKGRMVVNGTTEEFTQQMTTQRQYEESAEFMARFGVDCPEFSDLKRGGSFYPGVSPERRMAGPELLRGLIVD